MKMKLAIMLSTSLLTGMKGSLTGQALEEEEAKFHQVWKDKRMYLLVCLSSIISLILHYLGGMDFVTLQYLDLIFTYVLLSITDWKKQTVPNTILISMGCSQLLYSTVTLPLNRLAANMAAGVLITVLLTILSIENTSKFGMGDVKLIGLTIVFTGIGYMVQTVFWGMLAAFFYSIYLLLIRKAHLTTAFPFVPFMTFGMLFERIMFLKNIG